MRYEGQHPLAGGEARGHASVNEAPVNGVHPQTLEAQLIAEREAQQRKRDQAVLSMPLVGQPAAPGIPLAGYALPLEPLAPGTGGYTMPGAPHVGAAGGLEAMPNPVEDYPLGAMGRPSLLTAMKRYQDEQNALLHQV